MGTSHLESKGMGNGIKLAKRCYQTHIISLIYCQPGYEN